MTKTEKKSDEKKVRRKLCSIPTCKRRSVEGSKYCALHLDEQKNPDYVGLNQRRAERDKAVERAEELKKEAEKIATLPVEDDPNFPIDYVEKVTELEAMTYRALEAEARAAELVVKNLKHEKIVADRDMERTVLRYQQSLSERQRQIDAATREFDQVKQKYIDMVTKIAEKRGLDPKQMSIDLEALTIRDLRSA